MGLLTCRRCGVSKEASLENFPPHKRTSTRLDSRCRPCRRAYRKLHRKPPDGISKEEWTKLDGVVNECVICGDPADMLVTDHCHTSRKVRGKLCTNCNLGLGHFKDDPMLLEFAQIYLMWHAEDEDQNMAAAVYIETGGTNDLSCIDGQASGPTAVEATGPEGQQAQQADAATEVQRQGRCGESRAPLPEFGR